MRSADKQLYLDCFSRDLFSRIRSLIFTDRTRVVHYVWSAKLGKGTTSGCIPKVTVQDAYYKLKMKTHQMGIYCANNETNHCCLYDETIGTTGPNEVISLLEY